MVAEGGKPPVAAGARRARLAILGAALLWSTSGAGIKSAALTAWQIAGGRALFAGVVIALLLPAARAGWNRRVLAVGVAYALTTVLFVWANTLTTAANSIFLQDTAPIWVLLLGPLLLAERPTRSELLAAPVYLGGATLFFLDELGPGHALGNAIALLSGVSFAFLIVGIRALKDEGADAAILLGNLLAVAICLPGAAAGFHPGLRDLGIVLFLGVFQLGFSYVLFVRGLRGVSALEGSLLALLEPVLNPIWTFIVAGERPGPWAIAGGSVILAATVVRVLSAPAAAPAAAGKRARDAEAAPG